MTAECPVRAPSKVAYTKLPRHELQARATFVDEWLRAGEIDEPESRRLLVDAALGQDTGPVRWLHRPQ